MESQSEFVEVKKLNFAYSVKASFWKSLLGRPEHGPVALRDVAFSAALGEKLVVYGGAAAGKTTLLRVLTGVLSPVSGKVRVNGRAPQLNPDAAAGYVSAEENFPRGDTAYQVLQAFGSTHQVENLPARLGQLTEELELSAFLQQPAATLSTVSKMRLNLALAALSHASVILLDDVADVLGHTELARIVSTLFAGRTVIVSTRHIATVEALDWPFLYLENGSIKKQGTRSLLAADKDVARVLDAWVSGLNYQVFRRIKNHPGVVRVQLFPAHHYKGQKLEIELASGRYLPSVYDLLSQTDLVQVEEREVQLAELI